MSNHGHSVTRKTTKTAHGAVHGGRHFRTRLAIIGPLTDEVLAFGRQVGATDYACGPSHLSRERGYYGFQELMIARSRVEDAGLMWAMAGMPEEWTYQIKLVT